MTTQTEENQRALAYQIARRAREITWQVNQARLRGNEAAKRALELRMDPPLRPNYRGDNNNG